MASAAGKLYLQLKGTGPLKYSIDDRSNWVDIASLTSSQTDTHYLFEVDLSGPDLGLVHTFEMGPNLRLPGLFAVNLANQYLIPVIANNLTFQIPWIQDETFYNSTRNNTSPQPELMLFEF